MNKFIVALLCTLSLSATAEVVGDAAAGETKAAVCAACHAADGNSTIPANPVLAGQHAGYIAKQLHEFKDGTRANPIMMGMAAPLSEQDIADLAAYFSAQKANPMATPTEAIAAGEQLFTGGDLERGVTACIACHGPRGDGHSLSKFPKISSQHPDYIAAQLKAFRSGERNNDLNGMMRDVAAKLTDEDIAVLSKYLAGLH